MFVAADLSQFHKYRHHLFQIDHSTCSIQGTVVAFCSELTLSLCIHPKTFQVLCAGSISITYTFSSHAIVLKFLVKSLKGITILKMQKPTLHEENKRPILI